VIAPAGGGVLQRVEGVAREHDGLAGEERGGRGAGESALLETGEHPSRRSEFAGVWILKTLIIVCTTYEE